jgi:hypothetical protein
MWDRNIGTTLCDQSFLRVGIISHSFKVLLFSFKLPFTDILVPPRSVSQGICTPTSKSLPLQSAGGSAAMGREDQIEEREVLDSIFPDEITGK